MKVKRNTPQLLLVEEIPWFIAIMLFFFTMCFVAIGVFLLFEGVWAGLIFAIVGGGLGLGGMSVFVERLQLRLDANTGKAHLRRLTIFQRDEVVIPLEDIRRASGEATLSGSSNTDTHRRRQLHRPSLVLDDGTGEGEVLQPITDVFSSGGGAAILVRAVNEWLEQHREPS